MQRSPSKAKATFTADHTQTELKTRCLKCVYLIASLSHTHTYIVCFHFLSSIFGQVSCDFLNSCSASLSCCISVTNKTNFYVKLRYTYLHSYRYFQILFSLFRKSVQASGSFLCITAPSELGQTEDNQGEVWSVFIRWSRKRVLRRGRMAKTKRGIFYPLKKMVYEAKRTHNTRPAHTAKPITDQASLKEKG